MARPKGTGGRSAYDKYRKFGRRKTITRRSASTGKFVKGKSASRFFSNSGTHKRSRFSR